MAHQRIDGLDLARALAFIGMVIVNFKTVLFVPDGTGALDAAVTFLQGKAAAGFVVLAGSGFSFFAQKAGDAVIVRRAAFLFIIGLLNCLIFEADIIHYYAVYFLLGLAMIRLSMRGLALCVVLSNAVFMAMLHWLDYDLGWDWDALSYSDFWTIDGFIRNLFFNGYHPVFPWIGFFAAGLMLGRLNLADPVIHYRLMAAGAACLLLAEGVSHALIGWWGEGMSEDLFYMLETGPVPPTPFYTVSGLGFALVLVGGSLAGATVLQRAGVLDFFTIAGRQALTLYAAHILIGMGVMEVMGLYTAPQTLETALIAAMIFIVPAFVFSFLWARHFKSGPLETLMRRCEKI